MLGLTGNEFIYFSNLRDQSKKATPPHEKANGFFNSNSCGMNLGGVTSLSVLNLINFVNYMNFQLKNSFFFVF